MILEQKQSVVREVAFRIKVMAELLQDAVSLSIHLDADDGETQKLKNRQKDLFMRFAAAAQSAAEPNAQEVDFTLGTLIKHCDEVLDGR